MKVGDLVRYKDWYKGLIGRVIPHREMKRFASGSLIGHHTIHWFDNTFSYLVKQDLLEVISESR